jgi:RNA polymerase sigma-70 factor (ECF subfamily)
VGAAVRGFLELVEATVVRLGEHHRDVFVLRELKGRSYEEIAEIVGCNLAPVKSRLNRALRAFAELIAPFLD